jgi:formylglycine-generating enzyme required for sulfatase activity
MIPYHKSKAYPVCIAFIALCAVTLQAQDLNQINKWPTSSIPSESPMMLLDSKYEVLNLTSIPDPKRNTVVLRFKKKASEYNLFEGFLRPEAYSKLYRFSLNGIQFSQAIQTKFYRKANAKAFEDESNLYFDSQYIYSSSVPTLYIKLNGKWQRLDAESNRPSGLLISTSPSQANVYFNNSLLGTSPLRTQNVTPGLPFFQITKAGYWPKTEAVWVQAGDFIQLESDLLLQQISAPPVTSYPSLNISADSSHGWLDRHALALQKHVEILEQSQDSLQKAIASNLPSSMPLNPSWPAEIQSQWTAYKKQFDSTRTASLQDIWPQAKQEINQSLAQLATIMQAKRAKTNRTFTVQGTANQVKWELSKVKGQPHLLEFSFSHSNGLIQGKWIGSIIADTSAKGRALDSIKATQALQFQFRVQDKPVKIKADSNDQGYRYYRLDSLILQVGKQRVLGSGKLSFAPEVMAFEEVRRFVNQDSVLGQERLLDAQHEAEKLALKRDSLEKAETQKLLLLLRGETVEIDGGAYEFRGKKTRLSPFAMMRYEVSQALYERWTGTNPSKHINPNKPVHHVNWEQSRAFCKSIGGDLPTEAQWEYSARAGTNTYYYWGDRQVKGQGVSPAAWAVFEDNSGQLNRNTAQYGPWIVGSLRPNPWGLFDIAGNVREWVRDGNAFWYRGPVVSSLDPEGPPHLMTDDRVIKGGGWLSNRKELDPLKHDNEDPLYHWDDLGMRCAFPARENWQIDTLRLKMATLEAIASKARLKNTPKAPKESSDQTKLIPKDSLPKAQ